MAPSVFNFYSPFYQPQGGEGMVSPEMQISNEDTVIGLINFIRRMIYSNNPMKVHSALPRMLPDYSLLEGLIDKPEMLLLRLERLFFSGAMSANTREILLAALEDTSSRTSRNRVKLILYLALISPDQATTGTSLP
jgi:hypothetical protein